VALGVLAGAIGVAVGVLGFTFVYAKGYSYLTNDPAACANCHVMSEQYAAWQRGSHRSVATCNDCHTPKNLAGKYATKAQNGFWHSFYFTFGGFPEPIRIGPRNKAVTEKACRKCHEDLILAITPFHSGPNATDCLRCHRDVGHLH
jgi:cytochrome c nitrite reductase small subunit